MALYTTVMEEITAYTGLSPAAFFTIVVLMVALHRTLCGLFVAMGRNISNLILNRNNSSNTTAQPLHQLEEVTDHQLTLPGSSERNTSSMAFQGASSCSTSSTNQWTHDVFLSFRGEDTRYNFTAHLYQAFHRKGIKTFIDDELRRGEKISPALEEAIEKSRISIVVFSPNYASSTFCLDELLKILETKGQIVLPVFCKVDPSDVRHQRNSYKKAFAKHEKRFKDDIKVQRWKQALKQVADLSGWHLENNRNEAKFIDKIVQYVSRIVNDTYFQVAKHPVGIESRVEEINSILSIAQMNDIRMVGILGSGGIGKTTLVKAIYNLIAYQFEDSCFLTNVRETCLVKLQNKLLSKILGHIVEVDSVDEGITVIKKRLCSKRILLILDDVDNTEQLDKLAGGADWFGSGSRIIITTRDKKVLIDHEVDDDLIYRVKELDREEALELFRWNAFKGAKPSDDFLKLMEGAMNDVGGLPLALEVLGSDLRHRKDLLEWKSALNKYKNIPHKDIQKRLQISYDGLDENEKKIFLDIACFFIGKPEDDIKVLESDDYFAFVGINELKDRCLINTNNTSKGKILAMHNLLRDMGREVVRQESPEHPGKRSRLWSLGDVRGVFEDDTGTNAIQGILIDLPKGEPMWLSSEAFKNMKSLRLLMVDGDVHFSQWPIFLPNKLRVFNWPNCPLEVLPSNFDGRNLVVLRMARSCLKGLEGVQKFQSMKILDFFKCEFLKKIPDVSKIPNLEKLTLDRCTNLVENHDSVGSHDKLVVLSLESCKNLSSFPTSLKLRSLKYLNLDGCSGINHFPEIECEMKNLESINFGGTGIKELPSSIRYLTGLTELNLNGCTNLINLPSSIYQLQCLWRLVLTNCSKLSKFPEKMGDSEQSMLPPTNSSVSNDGCFSILFPALHNLYLQNCGLSELDFLRIFNCSSTLEDLRPGIVTIDACIERFVAMLELRDISNLDIINRLLVGRDCSITISGNKIPDWFNYRKEVSNSNSCEIDIDVPADLDGEITTIAFSVVFEKERNTNSFISICVISGGEEIYYGKFSGFSSSCLWLRFHILESFERKKYNGHLLVKFDWWGDLTAVKSCGVHLVRRCEEKMIDSIDGRISDPEAEAEAEEILLHRSSRKISCSKDAQLNAESKLKMLSKDLKLELGCTGNQGGLTLKDLFSDKPEPIAKRLTRMMGVIEGEPISKIQSGKYLA